MNCTERAKFPLTLSAQVKLAQEEFMEEPRILQCNPLKICASCNKKIPICGICSATLEEVSSIELNLTFIGHCSTNDKYMRYLIGYANEFLILCDICQNLYKYPKINEITSINEICICEDQLEE